MKILFASSEVFPYSKSGGLGDMSNFLPASLVKAKVDVEIITPYYKQIIKYHERLVYIGSKTLYIGNISTVVNYYKLKEGLLDIIFVQNQQYFERDNLYGYYDDDIRFLVLSYATLEYVDFMKKPPQIIHCNDWQTAVIPFLLDEHYRKSEKYKYIHTLLTIHNLQYQGIFSKDKYIYFNKDFDYTYIHFDEINFLKTGIERATMINTVSPNYRNEILTNSFGFTLDGALKKREKDLIGILNGIDYDVFNPETDSNISSNFNNTNYLKGKKANKKKLLEYFNIKDNGKPLVSFIGRLVNQKGLDLMLDILEDLIVVKDIKLVILGSGDYKYSSYFEYLLSKYPKNVGFYSGYNEELAHQIYAGSDMFLMPSQFEPCGLGQMIAMRYGSVPIVRETGGLKDTVLPYNKYTGEGTGFSFYEKSSYILKDVIFEAIDLFDNNKEEWNKLIERDLEQDFSLDKTAKDYIKLYEQIIGG